MKKQRLVYISQGHYNLNADCSDIESSIKLLNSKLVQIRRLTLSFDRIIENAQTKQKSLGEKVKKLVPLISQVEKLGLIIDLDKNDQNLFEFVNSVKNKITHLTLDINNLQSVELAIPLLKSIEVQKLEKFELDFFRISSKNKEFHKSLLQIILQMKSLKYLFLNFDDNEQFPEINDLIYPQLIKHLKIKGEQDAVNYYMQSFRSITHLEIDQRCIYRQNQTEFPQYSRNLFEKIENLKSLTIPNLNFVKLKQLVELETLKITDQLSENIQYQDFSYLQNLKHFKITKSIEEEEKVDYLNRIKYLPKGCSVHLSTYFLGEFKSFGKIDNILLSINNSGCIAYHDKSIEKIYFNLMCISQLQNLVSFELFSCHAEKYLTDEQFKSLALNISFCPNLISLGLKFFMKHIREPCFLTPMIEKRLALQTEISFFQTDFKLSDHFENYIIQRSINMLKLIVYSKLVSPSLITNPSLCFFDLAE